MSGAMDAAQGGEGMDTGSVLRLQLSADLVDSRYLAHQDLAFRATGCLCVLEDPYNALPVPRCAAS